MDDIYIYVCVSAITKASNVATYRNHMSHKQDSIGQSARKYPRITNCRPQFPPCHQGSNEYDLGDPLFIFSPGLGIRFITDVHDRVEDVLERMAFDRKDAFYSEDGAWAG